MTTIDTTGYSRELAAYLTASQQYDDYLLDDADRDPNEGAALQRAYNEAARGLAAAVAVAAAVSTCEPRPPLTAVENRMYTAVALLVLASTGLWTLALAAAATGRLLAAAMFSVVGASTSAVARLVFRRVPR